MHSLLRLHLNRAVRLARAGEPARMDGAHPRFEPPYGGTGRRRTSCDPCAAAKALCEFEDGPYVACYRCKAGGLECKTEYDTQDGRVVLRRGNNESRVDYINLAGRLYAIAYVDREGFITFKQRLDVQGGVVMSWMAGQGSLTEWEAQAEEAAPA